jgi:hypothetical protein
MMRAAVMLNVIDTYLALRANMMYRINHTYSHRKWQPLHFSYN